MADPRPGRAYTEGQQLLRCAAGKREVVTFVAFDSEPAKARVTLKGDGKEAVVGIGGLHALDQIVPVAEALRSMDRSGYRGALHDTDLATPAVLSRVWCCDHAHRERWNAEKCAAAELRRIARS